MAVIITEDSELGKELAKWNAPRPHPEFPRMMYLAHQKPNGQWACMDVEPPIYQFANQNEYLGACERVNQFNLSCCKTVHDEDEQQRAREAGWRHSPVDALKFAEERAQSIAQQAAERAWTDRNIGEKARRELDAAERATDQHVLDVPKKKGWPKGKPRAAKPAADTPAEG